MTYLFFSEKQPFTQMSIGTIDGETKELGWP